MSLLAECQAARESLREGPFCGCDGPALPEAALAKSNYPNCIGFAEVDVTRGCQVGCIYCGLRNEGPSARLSISSLLREDIDSAGVYLSPNCDAFAPRAAESSHAILERFLPEGVRFLIISKCAIPAKTIGLLAKYRDSVLVKISLSRLDDDLNSYVEPGAPGSQSRLATMRRLSDSGLTVGALAMPLFPGVDDLPEKLEPLIDAYALARVRFVKAAYVVLRFGQSRKDLAILERIRRRPVLASALAQMTETIRVQVGEGNVPPVERRRSLYGYLTRICRERRLDFVACSVLDPPILLHKGPGVPVCRNIQTFVGERARCACAVADTRAVGDRNMSMASPRGLAWEQSAVAPGWAGR
jgi:DNA repair photolyase